MKVHVSKRTFLSFEMCIVLLSSLSACTSPSRTLQGESAGAPQQLGRISKISNLPATDTWYEIQFVNVSDCFLSMPKGLWKSIDGGSTWESVHHVANYWETIAKVHFLDTKFGWMKTYSGWFKSEDSGQTWTPFVTPLSSSGSLSDVKFINRNTGWLGGAALRDRSRKELAGGVPRHLLDDITGKVLMPVIYRTDDGGKTWQIQHVRVNLGDIENVSFIDSDNGVAVSGPDAFYTHNGGKTWLEVNDPQTCIGQGDGVYEGQPSQAFLFNSSFQWLAFNDGRLLRTTDGGKKWVELQPCDQKRPMVIYFSSENHGFGLGSDRFLYETTDGGKQWTKIGTEKYDSLSSLDKQHVWLVSERGLFRINIDE